MSATTYIYNPTTHNSNTQDGELELPSVIILHSKLLARNFLGYLGTPVLMLHI